jgi:hypothetical protein
VSDIFASYDDQDRDRVRRLVQAFEAHGWSVWWDRMISTGAPFARVIERELNAASCVVVVWTHTSIQSDWVRAEADEGWKRGTLVPVLLDSVDPPMPYRQVQAVDLVEWDGERTHPGFEKLVADLQQRIKAKPARAPAVPVQRNRQSRMMSAVVGAGLLAVAALVLWRQGLFGLAETARPGIESGAPAKQSASSDVARTASGHWQASVKYPDGATYEDRFTFDVAGSRLSGTASMRGYGNRRGIVDGVVTGNVLSFRTRGSVQFNLFAARDVTYLYDGTLDDTGLRFTLREEAGGGPSVSFIATRISEEQANRMATGGTRPRIGGIETGNHYSLQHVRQVFARMEDAVQACYQAAEFDQVKHEFVTYLLSFNAGGRLEQLEVRPGGSSLDTCMKDALSKDDWGPTDTGQPGTVRLSITARLPWNP